MKVITIAGTATKDGEVKEGGMDKAGLGSFSLAVDDGYGANKSTIYFDCTFWGKRGVAVVPYVRKGSKLTVVGDLSLNEYNGKTSLRVKVNELQLQSSKPASSDPVNHVNPVNSPNDISNDMDDEIPF
jgi:single-strand DNA-binding protein